MDRGAARPIWRLAIWRFVISFIAGSFGGDGGV